MPNTIKKDFRLVPASGVTSGKGYRAEWVRDAYDEPLDFDAVIAEAQQRGAFAHMDPRILRSHLETFFDTLVNKTLTDAKTRKLDGYLELSLKIHGKFAEKTDDFDGDRHALGLVLTPLSAFRQKPKAVQPVNVNRIKQFRLSYLSAADGQHKNHEVVFGQEFIIRGTNLAPAPTDFASCVSCNVLQPDNVILCADAPILSRTDTEIRCAWPKEYGPESLHRTLWVSVCKYHEKDAVVRDDTRTTHASIL